MIRSRLRRPTSKSMTATFLPRLARPTASEALVVVLPTPPLPDVTTIISVNVILPFFPARASTRSEFRQHQTIAVEPGLHGLSAQILRHAFENAVLAGNRHQLRME